MCVHARVCVHVSQLCNTHVGLRVRTQRDPVSGDSILYVHVCAPAHVKSKSLSVSVITPSQTPRASVLGGTRSQGTHDAAWFCETHQTAANFTWQRGAEEISPWNIKQKCSPGGCSYSYTYISSWGLIKCGKSAAAFFDLSTSSPAYWAQSQTCVGLRLQHSGTSKNFFLQGWPDGVAHPKTEPRVRGILWWCRTEKSAAMSWRIACWFTSCFMFIVSNYDVITEVELTLWVLPQSCLNVAGDTSSFTSSFTQASLRRSLKRQAHSLMEYVYSNIYWKQAFSSLKTPHWLLIMELWRLYKVFQHIFGFIFFKLYSVPKN